MQDIRLPSAAGNPFAGLVNLMAKADFYETLGVSKTADEKS